MDAGAFVFNGIDGVTGEYLVPPLPADQVGRLARGLTPDPQHLAELQWWHQRSTTATFGPKEGVDPKDLAASGWGVIFAHGDDPAVREALAPLLEHRRRQAARQREHYYREFSGVSGYRPGESKQAFLARHGAGPGPADPEKVPYYLLIVGGPESVPFSFQYQLDVQYAAGRLCLDTVEAYASYAESVVAAERGDITVAPRAVFFGASNPDDRATTLSATELVGPLAERFATQRPDWDVRPLVGEAATKAALRGVLTDGGTPALLFSATHGVGFPDGHPSQRRHQGALVCQDWPGPASGAAPGEAHTFSADDIDGDSRLQGLVSFHFACFGAGTPRWDDFAERSGGGRRQLASEAFVAELPKRMLGHPGGGGLAAVGHVDRAWGYSFVWPGAARQTAVFESCLDRLVDGHPVGSAFEYFNERYAELSSDLTSELEEVRFGKVPDDAALGSMWTANNDARNFVVLGDPAVRLAVAAVHDGDGADAVATSRPATLHISAPAPPPGHISAPAPPASGPSPAEADYGVLSGFKETRQRLGESLNTMASSVSGAVSRAAENLTTLEVHTYVSDDVGAVRYDADTKQFSGAVELRAVTRLGLDGDLALVVPRQEAEMDDRLWQMHLSMVQQAEAAREALVKTAASTLTALMDALKLL